MAKTRTMYTDNVVGGTINMTFEDIGAFRVFSTALYGNSIIAELASIERRVQNPPVGPISQADLLWDLREILLRGLDQNFTRK